MSPEDRILREIDDIAKKAMKKRLQQQDNVRNRTGQTVRYRDWKVKAQTGDGNSMSREDKLIREMDRIAITAMRKRIHSSTGGLRSFSAKKKIKYRSKLKVF